jgi:hypothetical protein
MSESESLMTPFQLLSSSIILTTYILILDKLQLLLHPSSQ